MPFYEEFHQFTKEIMQGYIFAFTTLKMKRRHAGVINLALANW